MFRCCYGARNRNSVVVFTSRCEPGRVSLKLPESSSSHCPSKQRTGRKANAFPRPVAILNAAMASAERECREPLCCWHEIVLIR